MYFPSTNVNSEPRCQEILAEMVHTKDGSRVVRDFLARGNAKVSYRLLNSRSIS